MKSKHPQAPRAISSSALTTGSVLVVSAHEAVIFCSVLVDPSAFQLFDDLWDFEFQDPPPLQVPLFP